MVTFLLVAFSKLSFRFVRQRLAIAKRLAIRQRLAIANWQPHAFALRLRVTFDLISLQC